LLKEDRSPVLRLDRCQSVCEFGNAVTRRDLSRQQEFLVY
jgi:hypothetical protein